MKHSSCNYDICGCCGLPICIRKGLDGRDGVDGESINNPIIGLQRQARIYTYVPIEANQPLQYDTERTNTTNGVITYDAGIFTINETGLYKIDWQVSADSTTNENNYFVFGLLYNGNDYENEYSTILQMPLSGFSLIQIDSVPSTISINNRSNTDSVTLVPFGTQANIIILKLQ